MAVPTIAQISPTTGPTLGDFVIGITGTNFNVPAVPAFGTSLPWPQQGTPSVQVLVDGVPAENVQVFDSTFITCAMPKHAVGAVPIVVNNLDATGKPIAGETVTRAAAFTYALPIFTNDYDSDLARVVHTLLREIKKQFLQADVTYAVHTDYDPDTGDELHVTKFAKLPGLSLVGPDLEENRFYSNNVQTEVDDPATVGADGVATDFVETRAPYTVDLLFSVIGASDNKGELLNMMSGFIMFMHKNKFLVMDRDPNVPSNGDATKQVRYEMDFQSNGQPKTAMGGNADSNVRSFEAKFVIRGFDIEALQGMNAGTTAGVPNQAIVSRGKTVDQLVLDPSVQTAVVSGPGPSPGP